MDTMELLDKLEDLVENSKQLFNKAFVNIEDFYALTNKMRASLPDDIKDAARITREANQIVDDAKIEAARTIDMAKTEGIRIVEDARSQAAKMVDESEIKKLATSQAKEIIASSEQEALAVKSGADTYARDVLSDLETSVGSVMKTIQLGRDKLKHKSDSEKAHK